MAQSCPKTPNLEPTCPPRAPTCLQVGPPNPPKTLKKNIWFLKVFAISTNLQHDAQHHPNIVAKTSQHGSHDGPRHPNLEPRWAQDPPTWSQDGPKLAQDPPTWNQLALQAGLPNPPKTLKNLWFFFKVFAISGHLGDQVGATLGYVGQP